MRLRKGRFIYIILALFSLSFGVVATAVNSRYPKLSTADALNPPYGEQRARNAEWSGLIRNIPASFDTSLATNVSYAVVEANSYATSPPLAQHFSDVARLFDTAKAVGNNLRLYEYFNSTIWYDASVNGWLPYSSGFSGSWYLRDSAGNPIAHTLFGTKNGYWIDVTNPGYRTWAVNTIADWMTKAPYKGIALDSADMLVGTVARGSFGNSTKNLNTLLCGAGAPVTANGNCARVNAWNSGLTALIAQITQKLHGMGDEVIYNGIAPSPARDASRNTGLLATADVASNESFCYDVTPGADNSLSFESLAADADMMRTQAAAGKKIIQITNSLGASNKQAYAPYCLAGFLMGWQPGYDFWDYHTSYADLLGAYPETPEQNLNLGNPLTTTYAQSGGVLTRSFQNGFVAVNTAANAASVRLPTKLVQFSGGNEGQTYGAGTTLTIGPRGGLFFLTDSYLHPSGGGSGSGGGGQPGGPVATSTTAPKGTAVKSSLPLTNKVTGTVRLTATDDNGQTVKVEYYLNGKLLHTAASFPDTWSLDTTKLANGTYKLLIKYYKSDGSTTVNVKDITVSNSLSQSERLAAAGRQYAPPTAGLTAFLLIGFFFIHHYRLFRPRWLYKHDASIITGDTPADELPTAAPPSAQAPGAVINPTDPPPRPPGDR